MFQRHEATAFHSLIVTFIAAPFNEQRKTKLARVRTRTMVSPRGIQSTEERVEPLSKEAAVGENDSVQAPYRSSPPRSSMSRVAFHAN